jgi:acyl-CoA dehydrogenase
MSSLSPVRDLLVSSARSVFETTVTKDVIDAVESGRFPQRVWEAIDDAGLDLALVPEHLGGAGVSFADAAAILRVAGAAAAPVPFADSLIARRLLADCGLEAEPGPLTVAQLDDDAFERAAAAPRVEPDGQRWELLGTVRAVPFARFAVAIVVPVLSPEGRRLAVTRRDRVKVEEAANLAGEPRDTVQFDGDMLEGEQLSEPGELATGARARRLGAFSRAALMSGALERILPMTVQYARERIQFGRPIGQFQAMQQELAVLAGETAAALAATEAAAAALDRGDGSEALAIAVAKSRVGEAAGRASKIAHQVHGAIGFTHEHELHYRTRRLWAWRDEFGSEAWWAERVGAAVLASGAGGLWPLLTRTESATAAAR